MHGCLYTTCMPQGGFLCLPCIDQRGGLLKEHVDYMDLMALKPQASDVEIDAIWQQ